MPVTVGDSAVWKVSAGPGSRYEIGTSVLIEAGFTLADGVTPIAPVIVSLIVQDPAGALTTYTGRALTNPSEGVYSYVLDISTLAGPWIYKWRGDGPHEITSQDVYMTVAQTVFSANEAYPLPPPAKGVLDFRIPQQAVLFALGV